MPLVAPIKDYGQIINQSAQRINNEGSEEWNLVIEIPIENDYFNNKSALELFLGFIAPSTNDGVRVEINDTVIADSIDMGGAGYLLIAPDTGTRKYILTPPRGTYNPDIYEGQSVFKIDFPRDKYNKIKIYLKGAATIECYRLTCQGGIVPIHYNPRDFDTPIETPEGGEFVTIFNEDYEIGTIPNDWSQGGGTNLVTWEILENALGGFIGTSLSRRPTLTWNNKSFANSEMTSEITKETIPFLGLVNGIIARYSGTLGSSNITGYVLCPRGRTELELAKYINGTFTSIDNLVLDIPLSSTETYFLKLEIIDNNLRGKLWIDEEPDNWMVEGQDSDIESGENGLFMFDNSLDFSHFFHTFSIKEL